VNGLSTMVCHAASFACFITSRVPWAVIMSTRSPQAPRAPHEVEAAQLRHLVVDDHEVGRRSRSLASASSARV